ncbi:polysaccharide deacetylase family protein [Ramlibacter sp. 2FC]|uniref:polysaccharide deacetylase family protein n=1 Tax=Ramlibacter sp. 2FC TaxID=2502188 RepID=UPI00201DC834|nr:polysaccharide deacetylase family protein [Ramlibacter sp. 2FC]
MTLASADHCEVALQGGLSPILAVVDPPESWSDWLIRAYRSTQTKLLVCGALPPALAAELDVTVGTWTPDMQQAATCAPAPTHGMSESSLGVRYRGAVAGVASPIAYRPCLRYDFTDEWNNLGYGAIRMDGSIWACSQNIQWTEQSASSGLADLIIADEVVGAYAGLWDSPHASLLWFNRPVGPVDGHDWRLVETFLAHHRHAELPCQPVLAEVPAGYRCAVTMRLDCDEDVESARALWTAYREMGAPFSLALHAKVLEDPTHHSLPREVLATGGAILSHTATHAPDWGGSYEAALWEGSHSAAAIQAVTNQPVRYAVSPFHQTPAYARAALADAGYAGCIGGIIRNDPDFLMARAGVPPGSSEGFIGHSQQCMLHGDCMLDGDDPLCIFKQAFDLALASGTFLGYLDHPFSERYQYGWASETQRVEMHRQFIKYIQGHDDVLWANESDTLDFLGDRASVRVSGYGSWSVHPGSANSRWQVAVEYAGTTHPLGTEGIHL